MPTFRERQKHLAALEQQAEAEAEVQHRAAEPAADRPPYWVGCTVCDNLSDPRDYPETAPGDRTTWRCLWCGGADRDWVKPNWSAAVPVTFVCPRCEHYHTPADRVPSDWHRIDACPSCGWVPPVSIRHDPDGAKYAAWYAFFGGSAG